MSVTVTLNVFSGRPNPTWVLSANDAIELQDRLDGIVDTSNLKPASVFWRPRLPRVLTSEHGGAVVERHGVWRNRRSWQRAS
jgi:hypothetical protein